MRFHPLALLAFVATGPCIASDAIDGAISPSAVQNAPIYLYRDKAGLTFALQVQPDLQRPSGYRVYKHYALPEDIVDLRARGVTIDHLPYDDDDDDDQRGPRAATKSADTCTTTHYPTDFNITYANGVVWGNVGVCQTDSRPPGTNTQVVDFEVFSENYKGKGAHTPVVLWFKRTLHGHGMYFGDTSSYECSNGQPSSYNTRVEGWSLWHTPDPGDPPTGPYWSSTELNFNDTCGAPWDDGWIVALGVVTTKYRVNVHASSGQWVQYLVDRWNGSSWVTHTPPVVKNVTYSNWTTPAGPGTFDASANGLFIGSTPPTVSASTWTIGIRALTVGWF